jgi:hypothetical protein
MPSITNNRYNALCLAERELAQLRADGVGHQLAELEALRARHDALVADNERLNATCDELRGELMAVQQIAMDQSMIRDRTQLRHKLLSLVRQGVPCFMRGDFIYHSTTKAVLAQVSL